MPLEIIAQTLWTNAIQNQAAAWLLVLAAMGVLVAFARGLGYVLDAIQDRWDRRRSVQAAGLASDRRRLDAAMKVSDFRRRS